MNVTQLRVWIRKYGNLGVVMVGAYLAFRSLSLRRKATVIALLPLSCVALLLLHALMVRPAPKPIPVVELPSAMQDEGMEMSALEPSETDDNDGCPHTAVVKLGADKWKFEMEWIDWEKRQGDESMERLVVSKNGRVVLRAKASTLGGAGLAVQRMNFPFRNPIVAVESLPGMGHPSEHHFYIIRKGKLIHMGEVGAEFGGPVFVDKDGDGHSEWLFDDYCWYEHREAGPKHFLLYKMTRDGKLKLWKRLPNPRREHLSPVVDIHCV